MEIEAKYSASEAQFSELLGIDALGEYKMTEAKDQHLTDRYMDTTVSDILKSGYAFRIRNKDGKWIATLKGLGSAEGSIHRREEYEAEIESETMPQQWADSEVRDMILDMAGSGEFVDLCVIRQHRHLKIVRRNERLIGEMALDMVDIQVFDQLERSYEVEIELGEDGQLDDLHTFDSILKNRGLKPESRSKFERAMSKIRGTKE